MYSKGDWGWLTWYGSEYKLRVATDMRRVSQMGKQKVSEFDLDQVGEHLSAHGLDGGSSSMKQDSKETHSWAEKEKESIESLREDLYMRVCVCVCVCVCVLDA